MGLWCMPDVQSWHCNWPTHGTLPSSEHECFKFELVPIALRCQTPPISRYLFHATVGANRRI